LGGFADRLLTDRKMQPRTGLLNRKKKRVFPHHTRRIPWNDITADGNKPGLRIQQKKDPQTRKRETKKNPETRRGRKVMKMAH